MSFAHASSAHVCTHLITVMKSVCLLLCHRVCLRASCFLLVRFLISSFFLTAPAPPHPCPILAQSAIFRQQLPFPVHPICSSSSSRAARTNARAQCIADRRERKRQHRRWWRRRQRHRGKLQTEHECCRCHAANSQQRSITSSSWRRGDGPLGFNSVGCSAGEVGVC